MKATIATSILLLMIGGSGVSAATWGATAAVIKPELLPFSGKAQVVDGTYSEVTSAYFSASGSASGAHIASVEVHSVLGDKASASLEAGNIELVGAARSGAVTDGRIFDTLSDFKTHGGPLFMKWRVDFGVDPYGCLHCNDVPIANLGLSITGGGVSYSFSNDIILCPNANYCATGGQLSFPKTTTSIKIDMSMAGFKGGAGYPVVSDYFAHLSIGFAEICGGGPFLTCPFSYGSASGRFLEDVAPLHLPAVLPVPPAVVMLGSALAGLVGLARRRRTKVGSA